MAMGAASRVSDVDTLEHGVIARRIKCASVQRQTGNASSRTPHITYIRALGAADVKEKA
jgi:hypothetical protein